jgi:hypothetical protein
MLGVSEISRFLFSTLAVCYLKVINLEWCINFVGDLAYQRSHSLVI